MFLNRLHLNSLLTNPEIFVSVNEEDIVEISRTTGIMVDPVYNMLQNATRDEHQPRAI